MSDPSYIPYGRQIIDDDDIQAVVDVLKSDWLTTGPAVDQFEKDFAAAVEAPFAVAVSNGTAALHAAMAAAGIGPGDEVIVPPMTFAATSNAVLFQGARPVFADVDPGTLLLDPSAARACITGRTKMIAAVDYAGQPCDYDALRALCDEHGLLLLDDACHAVGGRYKNRPVGSLADLNTFSFHPVKHMTTGEGGMITTHNEAFAASMRVFRSHGITADFRQRLSSGSWFYEMVALGNNYRLSDLQAALGSSQLRKLSGWVQRRQELAHRYDKALAALPGIEPLAVRDDVSHAYHLYMIRVKQDVYGKSRGELFQYLRDHQVGVNVHYIPVHLHPYYRETLGTGEGLCPVAEQAYEELISLPMFAGLSDEAQARVIDLLQKGAGS